MKRLLCILMLALAPALLLGMVDTNQAMAVEEHHQQSSAKQPGTSVPQTGPYMMGGANMPGGTGQGMMGSGGGMGMMGGPGGGMGMMRMMGSGMMRMMMSHMMGGPGGMGRMMGGMGSSGGKGMGRGMMPRMTYMLEQLNLTTEQWATVRQLARERMEKMIDLQAKQAKLQIELYGLQWDQKVDSKRVKELFIKRAEIKAEIFLAGLEYVQALKKILTPEQAKKLDAFDL